MIERQRARIPQVKSLKVASARNFSGGWNTTDTPLNLNSKYTPTLNNLYPDSNGRLQLRFGTSRLASVDAFGTIIAMEYYNARLVLVADTGDIAIMDSAGNSSKVWTGWSPCNAVNFTQFDGKLVICNGIDKPVVMDQTHTVALIGDPGNSFSNVNVPRALYCATVNQYLVLATGASGGSTTPSTIFIGSKGTLWTGVGDPGDDNNAVNYIVSRDVTSGDPAITGMIAFRGRLLVATAECIVPMILGDEDTEGNHKPKSEDVIEAFGALSPRVMVALGDDVLLLDTGGVSSVQRALISGALSPVRESTLISRDIQAALRKFTPAQMALGVFAVHDRIAQQIMFFVPKDPAVRPDSDNDVFVYCFEKAERFRAWTHYDNMPFRAACHTTENRIFLARGNEVFYYHNRHEPYYMDGGVTLAWWNDGTGFTDGTGWQEIGGGNPIQYTMSTTWSEFKEAAHSKFSRYLQIDAEGKGNLTVSMYVDRLSQPSLSMDTTVNTRPEDAADYLRPLNQPMLYSWPAKFTRARFEVHGNATEYVSIVGFHIHYAVGTIGR